MRIVAQGALIVNDRTYAVAVRREAWKDCVPSRTFFSARSGEAAAAGRKEGMFGETSLPKPHHR